MRRFPLHILKVRGRVLRLSLLETFVGSLFKFWHVLEIFLIEFQTRPKLKAAIFKGRLSLLWHCNINSREKRIRQVSARLTFLASHSFSRTIQIFQLFRGGRSCEKLISSLLQFPFSTVPRPLNDHGGRLEIFDSASGEDGGYRSGADGAYGWYCGLC
jgi:hypothetical protein